MAVNKADSSVNFRITISTRKGKQLSHCCRDISSWRSNCGPHQRSSIGCRSWNTQQNSCFGGAPALGSAYGKQISPCTPQYIIFLLYTHIQLQSQSMATNAPPVSDRATVFDRHLDIRDVRVTANDGVTLTLYT